MRIFASTASLGLCLVLFLTLPSPSPAAAQARSAPEPADTALFRYFAFTVQERGELRFAGRRANVVTLRDSSGDPRAGGTAVLDVVSHFNLERESTEVAARRRVLQRQGVSGVRTRAGRPLVVDGVEGYELLADAVDARTGEPLLLYQAVLPEMRSLAVFEGTVGAARSARFLPQFRSVAETFHRPGVLRAVLGGVRYEIGGGYRAVPEHSDDRATVFTDGDHGSGLFLARLDKESDREPALHDVLRRVTLVAAPRETQAFRWIVPAPGAESPLRNRGDRRQGFNGSTLVVVSTVQLEHGKRLVLAGSYFVAPRNVQAAALGDRYVANTVDHYSAGEAFAWLVRSIAGESAGDAFSPPRVRVEFSPPQEAPPPPAPKP